MRKLSCVLAALGAGLLSQAQEIYRLDPVTSLIEIRVGTAGALAFMAHPHLIRAPIEKGSFIYDPADLGKSSVEVVVDASALHVIDPDLSAKDRQKVQATMQGDRVLGVKNYPKIVFKSLKIEALDHNRLRITGDLSLRSQTSPVIVEATLEQSGSKMKAAGESQFKQTTFGMRPVTVGLGTVRVQDQVNISFQVFGAPKPADHGS